MTTRSLSRSGSSTTRAGESLQETEFLQFLGQRVREFRSRRGMTRKLVSSESAVSERHLAQLEAGEGNVSIVLLRRIAAALGVSLVELFAPGVEERSERQKIESFLARMPKHRAAEIASRLIREFSESEGLRRKRVALIGVRGAGKSTLGAKLAKEIRRPFIELDSEIEKETGMPLPEIFSLYGQSGYRAIERRTLVRVLSEVDTAVFSVGGGIVAEKESFERLLSQCYTVWIKAQPEELMERVMAQGDLRVMAGSDRALEDLRLILDAREPLYRKADMCLDTSGHSAEESFRELKTLLQTQLQ
jgi:XRE family transcriptional regulator, aerobic/anaerobic benzoate catabolism transcriptional regulator